MLNSTRSPKKRRAGILLASSCFSLLLLFRITSVALGSIPDLNRPRAGARLIPAEKPPHQPELPAAYIYLWNHIHTTLADGQIAEDEIRASAADSKFGPQALVTWGIKDDLLLIRKKVAGEPRLRMYIFSPNKLPSQSEIPKTEILSVDDLTEQLRKVLGIPPFPVLY